jgi:alpha-glucosidase
MIKYTHWLMGMLLAVPVLHAADEATGWQHIGAVTHVGAMPDGVEVQAGRARVRIQAINDSVIRVRLAPEGSFPPDFSWAVVDSVRPAMKVTVKDSPAALELTTARLKVRIQKMPLLIAFLDLAGTVLQQDHPDLPMAWTHGHVRVWKTSPPDEYYYGLGDKAGAFNRRNQAYTMWNTDAFGWQESTDPLYKSVPFFLVLRRGVAYGVFFDNTYRSSFDFGKESAAFYSFGAEGGELNYYFFYGPHPKKVLEDYTALVGRPPLPPLWSLGYQQCRYSYYPEARVREIAQLFREKRIPADVIYLDIDYQDGNRPFTIDRKGFPNFEGMIRDLGAQGFKVIAITDPHIKQESGYTPYDSGAAGDHFVKNPDGSIYVGKVWPGDSVFPEFTLTRTREWWGTLYRNFVDMGIRGFWNDMNEPPIFGVPDKTMPLDTVHRLDDGTTKDHRGIHNVYGMLNARATYDGLRRLRPNERPLVLTRAAYAGTQRYAASWTGDNTSSWNHYRLTIPTVLSLGVSGYAFVGVDIGGFNGSPPADLLTRWIELGVFIPFYRNHTMKGSADQEPWVHGPEHEAIRRRYIELRYQLLPYIYTSFQESTSAGIPLMRPILLEFPDAQAFYGEEREFLFGGDLLVAPKVFEMLDAYDVNLPPGEWYDYWTAAKYQSGQPLKVNPPLDLVPLYVRAGSILPQQPVVQYTEEKPAGPLELRVYPGGDCRGSLYLDDGKTYAYTRGEYLRVNYSCQPAMDSLAITISGHQGSYPPWWEEVRVEVFGMEKAPKEVRAGGRTVAGWAYNSKQQAVTLSLPDSSSGWTIVLRY